MSKGFVVLGRIKGWYGKEKLSAKKGDKEQGSERLRHQRKVPELTMRSSGLCDENRCRVMRRRRRFVSIAKEALFKTLRFELLLASSRSVALEFLPLLRVDDATNQGREKAYCGREHAWYLQLPGPSNQRRLQFSDQIAMHSIPYGPCS